jgi:hypothetical protein
MRRTRSAAGERLDMAHDGMGARRERIDARGSWAAHICPDRQATAPASDGGGRSGAGVDRVTAGAQAVSRALPNIT